MTQSRESQSDINALNERLAKSFLANGRYNPHFLGVAGFGFIAIYILTQSGIFGEPASQLLIVGIATILLAIVEEWPVLWFARRRQGVAAYLSGAIAFGIFSIVLTLLWNGILPVAILLALATPAMAIRAGIRRRPGVLMVLVAFISVSGIISAELNSIVQRLQGGTPAAIASFTFLSATALLLVTITAISQNKRIKKLQNLLLLSFC